MQSYPSNWDDLLQNFLVISGVGKSGLTWMAVIVGTMKYAYHLNAPTLLKLVPPNINIKTLKYFIKPIFRSSLIHDHCCQVAKGLNTSDDKNTLFYKEWSWVTSQERQQEIKDDKKFNYRILKRLRSEQSLFSCDMSEGIANNACIKSIIPECKIINIVRNGLHVVSERVFNRWDTDWFYDNPCLPTVGWIDKNAPWFVSQEAKQLWRSWTNITRAAHIWRIQTESLINQPVLKYEDFVENPFILTDLVEDEYQNIKRTKITNTIKDKIKNECPDWRGPGGIPWIRLDDIQEPERTKFKIVMQDFGYENLNS